MDAVDSNLLGKVAEIATGSGQELLPDRPMRVR